MRNDCFRFIDIDFYEVFFHHSFLLLFIIRQDRASVLQQIVHWTLFNFVVLNRMVKKINFFNNIITDRSFEIRIIMVIWCIVCLGSASAIKTFWKCMIYFPSRWMATSYLLLKWLCWRNTGIQSMVEFLLILLII